jgi:chromosome segregation ATPase
MPDEEDVKAQLSSLRVSVDALTEAVGDVQAEVRDVRAEQRRSSESHKKLHEETHRLHADHQVLAGRLGHHEQTFAVHMRDYERQQEVNSLVHAHMAGATAELRTEVKEFRGEFRDHDAKEAQDRRAALKAQQETVRALKNNMITLLIAGGGLFLTLLGLLLTVWIYAQDLVQAVIQG